MDHQAEQTVLPDAVDVSDHKIMVVGDSPDVRRVLVNVLQHAGFIDVGQVSGSSEAFSRMRTEKFDLIMITGGGLRGQADLAFVRKVRANPRHGSLPILLVANHPTEQEVRNALKVGVNGFIIEPLTPASLRQRINHYLLSEK